jgi:hypothetical protein
LQTMRDRRYDRAEDEQLCARLGQDPGGPTQDR